MSRHYRHGGGKLSAVARLPIEEEHVHSVMPWLKRFHIEVIPVVEQEEFLYTCRFFVIGIGALHN